MSELRDYSGAFDPHIGYADFSKDFLLELLTAYSDYVRKLDGLWYLAVMERLGNDEAFACDTSVWEKMQLVETKMTCRLFNIGGHDVAALMKAFQMSPWMGVYEYSMELDSPNRGVVTITRCPTLLALEKEGLGREVEICQVLTPKLFTIQAEYFNPKMRVRGLKVPPRKSKDEVHCQWEFTLDDGKEGDRPDSVLGPGRGTTGQTPVTDLTDYSGEFDPSLKLGDFSKEFVVGLLTAYSDYIRKLDGFWYLKVKDRLGDDEAFACDTSVWEKMYAVEFEMTRRLFRIGGNDVEALTKTFQMSPWMSTYKSEFEMKGPERAVLTVTHCPTLLALEREGEGREQRICRELEAKLFKLQADFINPEIRVRALKLPPRSSPDEVPCQWEFSLEPERTG